MRLITPFALFLLIGHSAYANICSMLFPKRISAFEFCESACISEGLRSKVFDALSKTQMAAAVEAVTEKLFTELAPTKIQPGARIIEIGSGSGQMLSKVALTKPEYQFVLTDLYPQENWKTLKRVNLDFISEPVDVGQIKTGLGQHLRPGDAIFLSAALHHFKPEWVRETLDLLVEKQAHMFVLEPMSRDLKGIAIGLGAGGLGLATSKSAWSDLRVPFILSFDGLISALRQYHPKDLTELSDNKVKAKEFKGLGRLGNFRVMLVSPKT